MSHQIVDLLVELELVATEGEGPEALSESRVGLVTGGRNQLEGERREREVYQSFGHEEQSA